MTGRELEMLWKTSLSGRYDEREAGQIFKLWLQERHGLSTLQWFDIKDGIWPDDGFQDLKRLQAGEPIQYIIGEVDFAGLRLRVTKDVLIPRPETEDLVQKVIESLSKKNVSILDVGTGSGCIALALKKALPESDITGMDLSEAALQLAADNARRNALDVHWVQGDALADSYPPGSFDVIVSNPPYIPQSEAPTMDGHVRESEPSLALFVDSNDPLLFYKAIGRKAQKILPQKGLIAFETHTGFAEDVAALLRKLGYHHVVVHTDFTGKPRICTAEH